MIFIFTPKHAGKLLPLKAPPFNGTRKEAYLRARMLASKLADLFPTEKLSVRIDRTDASSKGYEIDKNGHTID